MRFAVLAGLRFSPAKLFRTEPEPSRMAPFRVPLLLSPLYNEALCVLVVFELTSDGGTHRAPYVLALSSKPHHIYSLMRLQSGSSAVNPQPRVCTGDCSKQDKNPFYCTIVQSVFLIAWRMSEDGIILRIIGTSCAFMWLEVLVMGSEIGVVCLYI